jgi:GTP pyrophosphokinase
MDTMIKKDVTKKVSLDGWEEIHCFIKGYALARNMNNTLIALSIAIQKHSGQYRKGGDPYIIHPLTVASNLIYLGFDDDIIIAAALLHDVVEDCYLPNNGEELLSVYNLNPKVLEIVLLLTKTNGYDEDEYYEKIKRHPGALLIKAADRMHNLSTLSAFSLEKMKKSVINTRKYIVPLCKYGKNYYPKFHKNYSNTLTIIKYILISVCEAIEALLNIGNENITSSNYKKTVFFINGYAKGKKMNNTLIALALSQRYHEGQVRQSGDPFIIHPLRVCSYLISLGLDNDIACAAALLHELPKKCDLFDKGDSIIKDYGIAKEVFDLVYKVYQDPNKTKKIYYTTLKEDPWALLIKLSNRAHTCTSLHSCTQNEKEGYLQENVTHISNLIEYGNSYYPNFSNEITIMEAHINSVSKIIEHFNKINEKN